MRTRDDTTLTDVKKECETLGKLAEWVLTIYEYFVSLIGEYC